MVKNATFAETKLHPEGDDTHSFFHQENQEHTIMFEVNTEEFESVLAAFKAGFPNLWFTEKVESFHSAPERTSIELTVYKRRKTAAGCLELEFASEQDLDSIGDVFRSGDPKSLPPRCNASLELGKKHIIKGQQTISFEPRANDEAPLQVSPQQELYELAMTGAQHSIRVEASLAAKFLTTGKTKLKSVTAYDHQGTQISRPCVLNGVRCSSKLQQYLSESIGKVQVMTLSATPEKHEFLISDATFFQLVRPVCQDIINWNEDFLTGRW